MHAAATKKKSGMNREKGLVVRLWTELLTTTIARQAKRTPIPRRRYLGVPRIRYSCRTALVCGIEFMNDLRFPLCITGFTEEISHFRDD
jgi:hypothetical protein